MNKTKCPFANIFGKPGTGVHSIRLFGLAAVDVALTMAAAYFIAARKKQSFASVATKLVLLGIVVHRFFGVDTALNELIFKEKVNCILDIEND